MGEAGVDRCHIAHVLNHLSVTHNTVTPIYDRYGCDKEKRAALEKWAEVLSGIVEVKPRRRPLRPDGHAVRTWTSSRRGQSDLELIAQEERGGCAPTHSA